MISNRLAATSLITRSIPTNLSDPANSRLSRPNSSHVPCRYAGQPCDHGRVPIRYSDVATLRSLTPPGYGVIIEWVPAGWVRVEAEAPATEESVSLAVRGRGQAESVGDQWGRHPIRTDLARGRVAERLSKDVSSVGRRRTFFVATVPCGPIPVSSRAGYRDTTLCARSIRGTLPPASRSCPRWPTWRD